MALAPGTRLGVYEIIAQIGAGGMGEVYQATDTNLKRSVAVKVLPQSLAGDADRLARFQREAEVLAALNHPNIAAIYGLERTTDLTALVMEFVDGEDLSQRIARGAIPLDEALPIAKQVAEAIESAHEQGIIHRDLKPANIKVRDDGTVKVLDFGLAKAMDQAPGSGLPVPSTASMSPTITTPAMMTGIGMILGTAAYMAPEQAKGRAADKRCDVWAFGCVLYEMLTARRAFDGEDMTDTIAAVVRGEPDWKALPAEVPPSIVTLIKRCLEKDRKARVSDIGVARFLCTETFPAQIASTPAAAPSATFVPPALWRRAIPVAATAVIAGAVVGGAAWLLRPQPRVTPVVRFALALNDTLQNTNPNTRSLALSPDGTRIAYQANRQLYLRTMAESEFKPIPGTLMPVGSGINNPAFSPDGESIAFAVPNERLIKRVAVAGGGAATVCAVENAPYGISWDGADLIFAQPDKGILRVPANGGQPTLIATVKSGEIAASPQLLAGGEWVLFTVAAAQTADAWDKAQIVAQSLKTSERKTLISGGAEGQYVPSGHIVYALGGVLFAVPFDVGRMLVTGGPVSVVEGVRRSASGTTGTAYYAVSANGSLVYLPGPVTSTGGSFDLALIDRETGAVQPLKLPAARYEHPRFSPDGKWVTVGTDDGRDASVWIHDVSGTASIRRLTLDGRNRFPVWSPDSQYVTFQSDREGDLGIWRQRANGTAPAERLTRPDAGTAHLPESWSPDGKTLLFSVQKGATFTAAALSMPDRKVTAFGSVQSAIAFSATFSPDGKWVAYEAKDASTGAGATRPTSLTQNPLFVQPFPPTGATYLVAENGVHATWSPDGKELFYGLALVSVAVTTRPSFSLASPVAVPVRFVDPGPISERTNDISRDGRKFLGVIPAGSVTESVAPVIQAVLNWQEELKQRVPTK